jgi:hypothetical protein
MSEWIRRRDARNRVLNDAILALWDRHSARDIGKMLDLGAQVVVDRAKKLGKKPRPLSAQPEDVA